MGLVTTSLRVTLLPWMRCQPKAVSRRRSITFRLLGAVVLKKLPRVRKKATNAQTVGLVIRSRAYAVVMKVTLANLAKHRRFWSNLQYMFSMSCTCTTVTATAKISFTIIARNCCLTTAQHKKTCGGGVDLASYSVRAGGFISKIRVESIFSFFSYTS